MWVSERNLSHKIIRVGNLVWRFLATNWGKYSWNALRKQLFCEWNVGRSLVSSGGLEVGLRQYRKRALAAWRGWVRRALPRIGLPLVQILFSFSKLHSFCKALLTCVKSSVPSSCCACFSRVLGYSSQR